MAVRKTNQMLANMNAPAALGWQSAEYMGFELGQTEIKANIQNGKLAIPPFTTTMNNGTLNFGANCRFSPKTRAAENIQADEYSERCSDQ